MMSCSPVEIYRRCGTACCLILQGRPEGIRNRFFEMSANLYRIKKCRFPEGCSYALYGP
jgi:hypothetical protein